MTPQAEVAGNSGKALIYVVPLADNREAILWLPKRLASGDAERMTRFIGALVMADQSQ